MVTYCLPYRAKHSKKNNFLMHFYHHVTHEREMHESAEKESRLI